MERATPKPKVKPGLSFLSLSEKIDLDNLDYTEFSGEELGLLFVFAEREENKSAKRKIANELFESI